LPDYYILALPLFPRNYYTLKLFRDFGIDKEKEYTTFCVYDKQGYQTLIYFDAGKLTTEPNSAYCNTYRQKDNDRRLIEALISTQPIGEESIE